jgi:hypothetical protein
MFPFSTLSLRKWYLTSVFASAVKHGIFGNTNGTCAITHERYMGTLLTKVIVEGPYNKDPTVKTSGLRGVYNKFHAHF